MGIKIKIKNPQVADIEIPYRNINKNFLHLIFIKIKDFEENDLFILKNDYVCFIFCKKILKFGLKNAENYILNCFGSMYTILDFDKIDKSSVLYKEHVEMFKDGVFLWKYTNRDYLIKFNFLSIENNKIYVNEKILDEKFLDTHYLNVYFKVQNKKVLYSYSPTVREYIKSLDFEERKNIIIKLLTFLFEKYSYVRGLCDGEIFDCNLCNFLINERNEFEFIDDDYVSRRNISYEYIIYYMLKNYEDKLYDEVMKYFGLKDKYRYTNIYPTNIISNEKNLEIHVRENLKDAYNRLKLKYFEL